MEPADLEPSAFDSSTRMTLLLKLTVESEAKLQELLAVKQTAALALEEGQTNDNSSSSERGDSGVVAASKYLEPPQERRLLEEEQACLKCLEELIRAKEMADRDNHRSDKVQVPMEQARVFTW